MTEPQTPPPAPAPIPTTAVEAQGQMDARTGDRGWVDRFLKGDSAAVKEFHTLSGVLHNGASADDVVAAVVGGKANPADGVQRQMANMVDHFRDLGISDDVAKQFVSGQKVTPAEYQAVANLKKELMGSLEFTKAYLSGDVKAQQRMTIINAVLTNGVKLESNHGL